MSRPAAARSAWSLLTVLGGPADPHPAAATYYGIVGAVLGTLLGALWWSLDRVFPALVVAALLVAADAGVTGMLHLDGLADCGDGLVAPLHPARRLEVMRAPDIGAFGAATLVLTLLLRVAALAALTSGRGPQPLLLVTLWSASRAMVGAVAGWLPYARTRGLPTVFAARGPNLTGAALGALVAVTFATLSGWEGVAALIGAGLGAAAVVGLAWRRLGGYTGDVLGATIVLSETVGLLAASAQW
jgi:adenosylcobinamide-GDP ribazoletransferase